MLGFAVVGISVVVVVDSTVVMFSFAVVAVGSVFIVVCSAVAVVL